MIRRLSIALAAVVLAGTLTSGCSTFTANRNAASVNDQHLSVKQYQAMLAGLAQAPDAFGIAPVGAEGLPGKTARGILGQWVTNTIMSEALASKGASVSTADRKALEDKILAGNAAAVWKQLSPELQSFVLDAQSLQPAFEAAFGTDAAQTLTNSAKAATVIIDSRYGMWDVATGQVVATR